MSCDGHFSLTKIQHKLNILLNIIIRSSSTSGRLSHFQLASFLPLKWLSTSKLNTSVSGSNKFSVQYSDSRLQTFFFYIREGHRGWVNCTFKDHKMAWEAELQVQYEQKMKERCCSYLEVACYEESAGEKGLYIMWDVSIYVTLMASVIFLT